MPNDLFMTANCRAAQGRPSGEHHCTGCPGCPCHHKAAPSDIRSRYEAALARKAEQRDDQADRSVAS